MNKSGRAVYFMLNPTDGEGATKAHVTAVRCIGLDLDGTPPPATFEPLPHIIVQTSENSGNPKYQVVWRIKPSNDFDYCKWITKRIAKHYGGDLKVTPQTQIFRLAGFYHQKGKLFRSRIVQHNHDAPVGNVDEFEIDLPLDEAESSFGRADGREHSHDHSKPEVVYDSPSNIARAIDDLQSTEDLVGADGSPLVFRHMCRMRDLGITHEKRVELAEEHLNPRFPAPCTRTHLEEKSRNADNYASGVAGNDTPEYDFEGAPEVPPGLEPYKYDETRLPEMLDHIEGVLIAAKVPLYQTSGRLVQPVRLDKHDEEDDVRREAGALIITDVNAWRLREYIIEHVPFHIIVKKKRRNYAVPQKTASHFLARADRWKLPVLHAVIETPTLRPDGSLLVHDGYDPQSRLLLNLNGVQYPEIKERPTREDALEALETLCWPFKEFPFTSKASLSVALSAVLTALVRPTLRSAPLHATDAPTPGTGKSLLNYTVAMIATGRAPAVMSQGANEEEDEKRYFAALLKGDRTLLIDNISRPISGDALCTILTEPIWQSRVLRESRIVTVPTSTLILATGNNLVFEGDMITRSLICRIDSKMEHPEKRRFDIDLKSEVPKRRPQLVTAGLTILRAFVVAGRPGLNKIEPFGRFEDWSNLVRGALIWLGLQDPCETRTSIQRGDSEREAFGNLLRAIHGVNTDWLRAGDIVKLGEQHEPMWQALDDAGASGAQALGFYLNRKHGQIVDGLRLCRRDRKDHGAWVYQVQSI
jgi:RepB DNA-primase from phage plasmid